jgi:hypothetical protein
VDAGAIDRSATMPRRRGRWILGGIALCAAAFSPQPRHVTIDVKPGDTPTVVERNRGGFLPVAILSTADFDATGTDPATIRIGPTGTEAAAARTMRSDVDRDNRADLMVLVRLQDLKITCETTAIRLTAELADGTAIEGSEDVSVEGCAPPPQDASPNTIHRTP